MELQKYNNFLTKSECEYIIEYTKNLDSYKNNTPNRNLEFYHITDYTDFKFLEDKLDSINIINKPVFNINKYKEGYYFLPHIDMGGEYDPEKERIRTVIINLSTEDSFSGGDLYVGGDKIKYKQGKALSFYSSTVHEVTKITKGFRYSIALWLKKDNLKFYDPEKGPKPSLI